MKNFFAVIICLLLSAAGISQKEVKLKKKDRKRDVELVTSSGTMIIRLSDSTPLHRDNFLRLAKQGYFDSLLFHRVINRFMIQAGDPDSKRAVSGKPLGEGGPGYTVPAEFRPSLFHKKGVIAAARQGDDANPQKASSGSQFYIVQGRTYTQGALDTLENNPRMKGWKFNATQKEVYKTAGGTPFLDQNYTVFGEVVSGMDVIDKIAVVPTSRGEDRDRPLTDVRILKTKLIKRKKY